MAESVKVHVYCGFNIIEADSKRGLNYWYEEPGECCWEDEIFLDKEDWEDGTASTKCLHCGAVLTQDMDHFTLIEEVTSIDDEHAEQER